MKPSAVLFGANHSYVIKGSDVEQVTEKGRELAKDHGSKYMQMGFVINDFEATVYQFVDDVNELVTPEEAYEKASQEEGHVINLNA